ncbi:MAG: GNAT family N-acetyltransferase [Bacteroidia bacterium]|nr:GNAT family N-acetyltransferase [Bacteroidia bacterium]
MLLSDKSVLLRALRKEDAHELALQANNKKIWDNLRNYMPYPYTEKDAEFFIELTAKEEPRVTFAIEFEGNLCGIVGLLPQKDVYIKTAEIGYWIGEAYWGKGIATVALSLLTQHALNTLDFVRLHTGVFEHNVASMRVLEKCGYEKDGVFKKCVLKNGKIIDEHRYSIV